MNRRFWGLRVCVGVLSNFDRRRIARPRLIRPQKFTVALYLPRNTIP